jgi:acyl-CoA thioesterase I
MIRYFLFILSLFILSSCGGDTPPVSSDASSSGKIILALGDSLTAGYGLPEGDSYPSQLEQKLRELGYNYRLQNAGVS